MTGSRMSADKPAGVHFSKERNKKVNEDLRVPVTEQSSELRSRKMTLKVKDLGAYCLSIADHISI